MAKFRVGLKGKPEGELVDSAFDLVLFLKTLFASGEVLAGLALFFVRPAWLNSLIRRFTADELREDPRDFLANLFISLGHHFTTSAALLAALYLLIHGLVKLLALFLLWRKILWAYPLSILVFLGFIVYQLLDFVATHSIFMILVSLLDVLLIILTWLEWRKMRGKFKNADKVLRSEDEANH